MNRVRNIKSSGGGYVPNNGRTPAGKTDEKDEPSDIKKRGKRTRARGATNLGRGERGKWNKYGEKPLVMLQSRLLGPTFRSLFLRQRLM